jgi:excisionase family DNA binding protein
MTTSSPRRAPETPAPNRAARRHPEQQPLRGYIGIIEAATYLDVAPKTIRKWIATGELTGYRWGTRLLKVRVDDLDGIYTASRDAD